MANETDVGCRHNAEVGSLPSFVSSAELILIKIIKKPESLHMQALRLLYCLRPIAAARRDEL